MTTAQRFWVKVRVAGPDDCWLWAGASQAAGYGHMWAPAPGRTYTTAHRIAWELVNGPIPPGLFVCHRCDNPPCVNPRHLYLATPAINDLDKHARGRYRRGDFRGVKNGRARLTPELVMEIRRLSSEGATAPSLARQYGVGRTTIQHVIYGHTWRDVDPVTISGRAAAVIREGAP